ncbi:MAG: hypothetical protein ABIL25_06105 [candidate division WOR-3 bacterium]
MQKRLIFTAAVFVLAVAAVAAVPPADNPTEGMMLGTWTRLKDVNGQPSGKAVKGGGGIIVLGGKVYLVLGNNKPDFMKYSIAANTWVFACSIPLGPDKKKAKKGAWIVNDGQHVYVLKGGGTNEFFRYDTLANSFESYASPDFTKGVKNGAAVCVEYAGKKYIYALSGSNTNEWKRFNLETRGWEPASPASLPVEKAKAGSGLTSDGAGNVFFITYCDGENRLFKTNIGTWTGSWTSARSLPSAAPGMSSKRKKVKEGACLEYYDGKVWAVKGGSTREFWVYVPERDSWGYVGEVANGVSAEGIKCGRSLAAGTNGLYCIIGKNTNEFWLYNPAGIFASSSEPGVTGRRMSSTQVQVTAASHAAGLVQVHYSGKGQALLTVRNCLGQHVWSGTSSSGTFIIPGLQPGSYFLGLTTLGHAESRKLTILR